MKILCPNLCRKIVMLLLPLPLLAAAGCSNSARGQVPAFAGTAADSAATGKQTAGVPVDLGRIHLPSMVIATREDHIVPWESAYRGTQLLGGDTEFILGASGHVAGIVNPARGNRRHYWTNIAGQQPAAPQHWFDKAQQADGSWWPYWMKWLLRHSGRTVAARKTTGSTQFRPIEPAPGRYVRERGDLSVSSRTADQLSLF